MAFCFDNSYARLPERFFSKQLPAQVLAARLLRKNEALAAELGLPEDWQDFSGNTLPAGAEPLSQAYAGHQFGGFVPQLGDGRAILLGEVLDAHGRRRDIQLKGAGRTAFSRGGDGKSALGPVLREYLVSEAMHALGVPSTRALAAVATGEVVVRETPVPGGVFTRVAASHIRVGTFQFFAARQDTEALRTLAAHCIERHYPAAADAENPILAFLEGVISAQATLMAKWLPLGFIHGVMNTDNCAISGETIDYGPCAFMDVFHPDCVFSFIDRRARYAWSAQPNIAHWNLTRLAETLLPLLAPGEGEAKALAQAALGGFPTIFQDAYQQNFLKKMGLERSVQAVDFLKTTLELLAAEQVDFTLFFRHLTLHGAADGRADVAGLFGNPAAALRWLGEWQGLPKAADFSETMRAANPILIPRNHRIEQAIQAAYAGDFSLFHRLADALVKPFQEDPANVDLEAAPLPHERVANTFCGT